VRTAPVAAGSFVVCSDTAVDTRVGAALVG
jgi:hypothetical protein